MTAWLMAHGPIPSFQKYLLEPARLSSPGLVYGKYAQEAVSLTEEYRGVLRICPWTNSVIWMDLEWSGYISAQRDVSLFFFGAPGCLWSSPHEANPQRRNPWSSAENQGWHLVEMGLSSIVIGCSIINHPFWGTSGTSIYGNHPQICWNIRPLYSKYLKRAVGLLQRTTSWRKQRVRNFRFQALQFATSRFVMVCLGNYPKVTSPFKFIYPQYIHILSACSRKVVRRATWLPRCIRYPNPSANLPKSGQHVAIPPRL